MSQKAWLAFCIAVLLPVAGYLIADKFSKEAVIMPKRYHYDTVIVQQKNGKEITDTVWHRVSNLTLTNQLGQQVSLDDLQGHIIVADFFFTHCPSICPALTRNMKKLQDALKLKDDRRRIDTTFVHFISFTVDPERDSFPALRKYADRFGVNPDVWWMLTGPKKAIYDHSINEFKLGLQDGEGVDTAFIHTDKFVLLDKQRVVRGYYSGLDSNDMARLAKDIVFLQLEKDKKKKRKLF
ncbi:MAG TPA: SCO family protein [Chitinophagaceae bacterium]|nr:SCO family protein [Chitinophagaceae bacterium]